MRLRSSQFVFLMLLVCSVQIRQEYALQWITDAVSGRSTPATQSSQAAASAARPSRNPALPAAASYSTVRLDSAARAASRHAWPMRRPASHSASVISFTGLLRL